MLYWADRDETRPGIYRTSVVNPARETLVTARLREPDGLTADFTGITSDTGNLTVKQLTVYNVLSLRFAVLHFWTILRIYE